MALTNIEWLKKHIKKLEITNSEFKDKISEIVKIKPLIYNEFRHWTPLKLILLNYALDVCTMIINKSPSFKKMYYVDLFAGSGINKIKEKEDFLIGSPLIATLKYSDKYTKMFFCENNSDYYGALKLRLEFLKKENLDLIPQDCNNCLDNILNEITNPRDYTFFFIDPYCMEFYWESMKKVLQTRSDIIFTFMSNEIKRALGSAKKQKREFTITKFFGDKSWEKADDAEQLVEIYKENILKERSNGIVRTIKIQSKEFGFCYHLFFITNKTSGKNPWLKAIESAKKEIENNSDLAVKSALDIVKKRQAEIFQF